DRGTSVPALITAVTLSRPILSTEYDTRQTADVLIAVGKTLGDDMGRSLPFGSAEEIVKAAAAEFQKLPGQTPESSIQSRSDTAGSQETDAAADFWNRLVESGVWTSKPITPAAAGQPKKGAASNSVPSRSDVSDAAAPDASYPLILLAYEHPALGFG